MTAEEAKSHVVLSLTWGDVRVSFDLMKVHPDAMRDLQSYCGLDVTAEVVGILRERLAEVVNDSKPPLLSLMAAALTMGVDSLQKGKPLAIEGLTSFTIEDLRDKCADAVEAK